MFEKELKKYYKLATIISYAVLVIVLIYAIVIELFRNMGISLEPLLEPQAALLAKIAAFFMVASIFIIIKQVSKTKLKEESNKTPEAFLQNIFFVDMIKAAIFEVPAFIGFILFFLTGAYAEFYILSAFSVILVISNFPKAENWTKELRRRFN